MWPPLQATAWAALSGIGLALVIPCVQAIIAELYSPYERGRAFGVLFTVSALGKPAFTESQSHHIVALGSILRIDEVSRGVHKGCNMSSLIYSTDGICLTQEG